MKTHWKKSLVVAGILSLCLVHGPAPVQAASQTVTIQSFAFNPPTVTVQVGDSVTWMNRDSVPHTSTSDVPTVWDSGLLSQGQSFPFTFTMAGSFAYHCTVHPFMHGSVMVNAVGGTMPPVVQITSPINGATFTDPTNVMVSATASSPSGTITNVEFLDGVTPIGEATVAPYSVILTNLAPGAHQLTAKATDNHGGSTVSPPVGIQVNAATVGAAPVVQITSPASGAVFTAPTNVTISVTASSAGGTVTNVQFLDGTTVLGNVRTAPYTFVVTNISAGAHQLTAKATDNVGTSTVSSVVNIQVNSTTSSNLAPVVQITSPASGAVYRTPTNVTISATASSPSGTITNVAFLDGTAVLGNVRTAPYTFTITNIAAGAHQLTAKATDNHGASTVSTPVNIQVGSTTMSNQPPAVQIVSPLNGAVFTAPTNVTISATASAPNGSVSNVEFLDGTTPLGTLTNAPYTLTVTNIAGGSHQLIARVTDNLGVTIASVPVTIQVMSITISPITNVAPVVTLTQPGNGAVFLFPTNILLQPTVTPISGSVAQVQFFAGSNSLGTITQSPYSLIWSNPAVGTYAVQAMAVDSAGNRGTSAPVNLSVTTAAAYAAHNVGSDLPGVADVQDTNVVNPWGLASGDTGPFVLADNHTGLISLYTPTGVVAGVAISVPAPTNTVAPTNNAPSTNAAPPSAPTGIVFNDTTDFLIATNRPATFIVATEDGTIAAWNRGESNAVLKVDNSASNAVYKGIAIGRAGGSNLLFATDFHNRKIDVFDGNYRPVKFGALLFEDPAIPIGYAPFGIQNIQSNLFVTYAMQDTNRQDDVSGPGHGFVDVFSPAGNLLSRFATNGALNSPWGMAMAPEGFGRYSGALLIGNFGDGHINAFDPTNAVPLGALTNNSGGPITIDGLWGLRFGNGGAGGDAARLYFTAGISGGGSKEDHGLFGRISAVPFVSFFGFTGISETGTNLNLTWIGGKGPFVLQRLAGFSGTNWVDVLTTTNNNATAPMNGPSAAFRLKGTAASQ